ncbi:MAG: ABC transporter permease subunit [Armatimonadetes bacterium]|nr:ABC transporter permease subunit [Armatimonadota bacterium]
MWRSLVTGNPMLIELKRMGRRMLGSGGLRPLGIVVSVLILALWVFILGLARAYELEPEMFAWFELFLFCLLIPPFLYTSIAGEKERKSWDILLVTPVSSAQIVAGKFFMGVAAIMVISVLFSGLMLVGEASLPPYDPWRVVRFQVFAGSFALVVAAFTLLASSWAKRSVAALATVYTALFVSLAVLPVVFWTIVDPLYHGYESSEVYETVFFLHPFVAFDKLAGRESTYGGLFEIAWYVGLTAFFLLWTRHRIRGSVRRKFPGAAR